MGEAATADAVDRMQALWRAGQRPDLAAFLADSGVIDPVQRLDLVREDQYQRWRAGERVPAEDYLPVLGPAAPEDALVLIWAEVRLRAGRGEAPDVAEYQRRFPAFADALSRQFELERLLGSLSDRTLVMDGDSDAPAGAEPTPPGYEILGEIGRGAMGVVYRARQVALDRVVALKVLRERDATDADRVGRFQLEAALAARHQHPNIVQVFEYGVAAGRPFLAMEYVAGPTLARAAGRQPQLPRDAARQVETLAEAIHFAHTHGVVHRDLKPANVLIDPDGRLKVADFGLAKELEHGSSLTATGVVLGTPAYMAPEQAASHGHLVGPGTDVYALGAILYELLTGRPPFRGESPVATLQLVIAAEPTAPSRLVKVPRDLETICLKCLEKDPARRYRSAAALAEDLRRFQAGETIAARPVRPWERAGRWARRNPSWAATLTAVAALLAVIAVGGVVGSVRLAKEADDARLARAALADQLWEAQVARARALRVANGPNARRDALDLLRKAAAVRVTDELRTEYVAALALPDVTVERAWDGWPGTATSIAFSDAFDRYARVDGDAVVVRAVDGDAVLGRLTGTGPAANRVSLSPDGEFVAALFGLGESSPHQVRMWRRAGAGYVPAWESEGRGFETKVAFDPASRRAAVVDGQAGRAWTVNLADGRADEFEVNPAGGWLTADHHPTAPRLAVSAGGRVHIYHLDARRPITEVRVHWTQTLAGARWHPDGERLLLSWPVGDSDRLGLVDPRTGQLLAAYDGPTGHGTFGAAGPHGPAGRLVAANNWADILWLFDAETGLPLFRTPADTGQGLRFDRDGLVGPDLRGGQVRLFRAVPSPAFRTLPVPRSGGDLLAQVDFDNRSLVVGDGKELTLWDLDTGGRTPGPKVRVLPMHFEKPGQLLALGEDGLKRWALERDPTTGAVTGHRLHPIFPRLGRFPAYDVRSASTQTIATSLGSHVQVAFPAALIRPQVRLAHRDARCVVISRDGRWVATCGHFATPGDPNNVKVWDTARPDPRTPARELPVGPASMAAFSPDGQWLATATLNGGCQLWPVGTWEPGPTVGGTSPLFAPDSRVVVTETGLGELKLCDVPTGRELVRLTCPLGTRLRPLCFSPDGGRLVAWGRETQRVHVWELAAIRAELQAHGLDW